MKTPLFLYPGKLKATLLLLFSLSFVVMGIYLTMTGRVLTGLVPIIFFSLSAAVAIFNFVPKASYLKLDENGIEMCNLYKKSFLPWQAVQQFSTGRIMLNKTVYFELKPEVAQQNKLRLAKGSFPDTYGMTAEELTKLLTDYQKKYS